jgi:hypothetical protein
MSVSAAPSSTPYGNAVVLSASGLPGDATGTVSFKVGTTTLCTASLPTPSCDTSSRLAPAAYSVTAIYSGDTNYVGASAATSFTITKSSAYSMSASASPGSTPYGNAVLLTASGLPLDATGTVSFASGAITLCSTTLPAISCDTTSSLGVGAYEVIAAYSGDNNYNGSSAATSFTITKSSGYSMSASATPSSTSHGSSVALLASGLPGGASGTVTFTTGATTLCSASVLAGAASCPTAVSLGAASYSVTAAYSGDANYNGSSAGTSFTITQSSGYSMIASASPTSTSYGNLVTLSASGLPTDATGTVSFMWGTTTLCTANLPMISCDTSPSLGVASYSVTATYSGDTNYEGTSAGTSFAITKYSDYSMTAAASPGSSVYGNAVSLSVTGLPGGVTGTVSFSSGTATLCTASLPALTCNTSSTLAAGDYSVTTTYSGDSTYEGASASTSFAVTKSSSYSMSASATPASAPHGDTVSLSVSGLPSDATGTVSFQSGAMTLCTASVSNGTAACSTATSLAATKYGVTATYPGDSNYEGASAATSFTITKSSDYSMSDGASAATSFTITKPPSYAMTASATPSSASYGTAVSLSVSGLPGNATGAVTFEAGVTTLCTAKVSDGTAACSTATSLVPASYSVTATYSGDSNYDGSSASTSFTITRSSEYSMSASAAPGVTAYGNAVSLSASGLPGDATGTVSFSSGTTTLCTTSLPSLDCDTSPALAVGSYRVTATYSGDANYEGAVASTGFTITRSSDAMIASAIPGSAPYGSAVSLSASGLPADVTGSITFRWHSAVLCTSAVSGGGASCTAPSDIEPRRYAVSASYGGNGIDAPATASTAFTVTRASPVLAATALPASVEVGKVVVLSAVGLPSGASGTIEFEAAGVSLCTTTLPSISCSTPSTLAARNYAVTASYSGNTDYSSVTARTAFKVVAHLSATNVTLYTHIGNTVSSGLPLGKETGPVVLEITHQSPKADGTCSVTPSGRIRFVPAPGFVGTATCTYVVRSPIASRSVPASVKIIVTSIGSPIPTAHTGEPWAGSLYWQLAGLLGLAGFVLIGVGVRRRRGLRHV